MDNSSREYQSETGRGIDSLVSPSSLFYTVSGNQTVKQSPKYYQEILGCPSILKPSFRDLPGCTRLSVGVPSSSFSQYPLDKLNKTMGKSTAGNQSKRHNRGENKYLPPIKVNAKIRHIYSQLTASSQHSSIASISTQTDFEFTNELYDINTSQEKLGELDQVEEVHVESKRDAFTCMSPPLPTNFYNSEPFQSTSNDRIPPSYFGKLEDLEKITGHIVIQRFFTRADEAFGCWLEKQLGVNNKSVGVDTSETIFSDNPKDLSLFADSKVFRLSENDILNEIKEENETSNTAENIKECRIDDAVKCECFLNHFSQEQQGKRSIVSLTSYEKELLSQCLEYEVQTGFALEDNANLRIGPDVVVKPFIHTKETERKRLSQEAIDHEVTTELLRNMDQLIDELPHPSEELIIGEIDSLPVKCGLKQAVEKIIEDNSKSNNMSEEKGKEILEITSKRVEYETFETKEKSVNEQIEIIEEFPERICIPDVINVSDLINSKETRTSGIQLEDGISNLTLESQQCKVTEYLGKIDPTAAAMESEEVMDDLAFQRNSEDFHRGERSGQNQQQQLKRSVSVDSCIGTESSGETKNALNDSGILLDSGRVDFDNGLDTFNSSGKDKLDGETIQLFNLKEIPESLLADKNIELKENEKQEILEQEVERILNNKSLDESVISRSEQSSAVLRGSDGDTEDADQSESESNSEISLQRPRGSAIMPVVTEDTEFERMKDVLDSDDDDEGEEGEEPDQFDAMIETHEREKRLRPICRKRNMSTQTTKSVESSILTSDANSSRSTTATSNSSFDLEFVSKKYVTNVSSGNKSIAGEKRRSYLPSGSSSLNILNMKFTMGREFESEFSIRIPPKSPSGSISSLKGVPNLQMNVDAAGGTSTRVEKRKGANHANDSELKSLWKDVKSKMESRVGGESQLSQSKEGELLVTGSRMRLVSYDEIPGPTDSFCPETTSVNVASSKSSQKEDERIKRSLKRLKQILDD